MTERFVVAALALACASHAAMDDVPGHHIQSHAGDRSRLPRRRAGKSAYVSASNLVVVIVGIILVVAFVAWLVLRRNDPERAAGHTRAPRTGSALFHGDPDDRPAGPGAEADGVAAAGQPAPGPSAESPPMH